MNARPVWIPAYVRLGLSILPQVMSRQMAVAQCHFFVLATRCYQMLPARVCFRIISSWSVEPCRFHNALHEDAAVPWCSCAFSWILGTFLGQFWSVFLRAADISLFLGWSLDADIVVFRTPKPLQTHPELTSVQ